MEIAFILSCVAWFLNKMIKRLMDQIRFLQSFNLKKNPKYLSIHYKIKISLSFLNLVNWFTVYIVCLFFILHAIIFLDFIYNCKSLKRYPPFAIISMLCVKYSKRIKSNDFFNHQFKQPLWKFNLRIKNTTH